MMKTPRHHDKKVKESDFLDTENLTKEERKRIFLNLLSCIPSNQDISTLPKGEARRVFE